MTRIHPSMRYPILGDLGDQPEPITYSNLSARHRNRIWLYTEYWRLRQYEYDWRWSIWRRIYWLRRLWRYVDDALLLWNFLGRRFRIAFSGLHVDKTAWLPNFLFLFPAIFDRSRVTRHGWSTGYTGATNIFGGA